MKRHKWENITPNQFSPKRERCINCGIERNWCGGDMQGWEYVDFNSVIDSDRTTFIDQNVNPTEEKQEDLIKMEIIL